MASRPTSLRPLRLELDTLLEDYLALLDSYQLRRQALSDALKQGYFHLAQSKLALGPARVGQASYHGGQRDACVGVSLAAAEHAEGALSWALERRTRPTPPEQPSAQVSSQLRHRAPPASSSPAPPEPARAPASPLLQFAALPPPSLRAAAASFERVVEATAGVVEAEQRLRDAARRVKNGRRRVESERRRTEAGETQGGDGDAGEPSGTEEARAVQGEGIEIEGGGT
ncbi:hypothetical protein JCM1841_000533 [Sporobolomyces salmonicolor]